MIDVKNMREEMYGELTRNILPFWMNKMTDREISTTRNTAASTGRWTTKASPLTRRSRYMPWASPSMA